MITFFHNSKKDPQANINSYKRLGKILESAAMYYTAMKMVAVQKLILKRKQATEEAKKLILVNKSRFLAFGKNLSKKLKESFYRATNEGKRKIKIEKMTNGIVNNPKDKTIESKSLEDIQRSVETIRREFKEVFGKKQTETVKEGASFKVLDRTIVGELVSI